MNTKTRKKEENLQNDELRDHLYAQIEVEWNNNRNADLVDELAFRHPELANELYEFFALLVQMEIEDEEENGIGGIVSRKRKRTRFALQIKAERT